MQQQNKNNKNLTLHTINGPNNSTSYVLGCLGKKSGKSLFEIKKDLARLLGTPLTLKELCLDFVSKNNLDINILPIDLQNNIKNKDYENLLLSDSDKFNDTYTKDVSETPKFKVIVFLITALGLHSMEA